MFCCLVFCGYRDFVYLCAFFARYHGLCCVCVYGGYVWCVACGVWYGDGMVVDMEWVWLQVTGFKGQFNV